MLRKYNAKSSGMVKVMAIGSFVILATKLSRFTKQNKSADFAFFLPDIEPVYTSEKNSIMLKK